MRFEADGHLRLYEWQLAGWAMVQDVLGVDGGDCGYPTVCREYGICLSGQYTCPFEANTSITYFRQIDSRRINLGCEPVTAISCQSIRDHKLLVFPNVSYFDCIDPDAAQPQLIDEESCKQACLRNCSCKAALFMSYHNTSDGSCYLPSRLLSLQIHGGSSGIGTFAIQIAKHLGIKVFVTAGSEDKLAACKGFGADVCINYKTEDFVARVKEETNGKGVDVILDNMGGSYLQRNLNSLGVDGRLFIIGFQGGTVAEVNLQAVFARRLTIQAAGLRNKSLVNKALIVSNVEKNVWPAIAAGKVKPVVYKTFPLSEAAEAHKLMETSSHIGKILLLP